jgi:hypothetical protein
MQAGFELSIRDKMRTTLTQPKQKTAKPMSRSLGDETLLS